jgi:hypothetical protein
MSHVATVNLEIKDLAALARACKNLGLKFNEGQKSYQLRGVRTSCDHAISVGASEIGVSKDGSSYKLSWYFNYAIHKTVGYQCATLKNEYAKEVARGQAYALAKAKGWTVSEDYNQETGETTIRLRMY